MKNRSSLFGKYLTAETKAESLLYENRILAWTMFPLLTIMSVINYLIYPLSDISSISAITDSIVLFCIGLYIWGVVHLSKSIKFQLIQIIIAFVLLLVFVFLNYYELIGLNVWLVYVGIVIIAIFRNDSKLLIAMVIEGIFLLGYISFRYGEVTPVLELVALSIIIIAIIIVAAVGKKVFTARIELIYDQLKQSKMVAQISSELININMVNKEDKILKFLETIGNHYDFDRTGILLLSDDKTTMKYEYKWHAADLDLQDEEDKVFVIADCPWLDEIVKNEELLFVNDIMNDDTIGRTVKRRLLASGIKSFMMMPIFVHDELKGFFTSHTMKGVKEWRDDQKGLMNVIPDFLSSMIAKLTAEKEMNRMAYYDALTGLPNQSLLKKTVQDEIEKAYENDEHLAMMFIDLDSFKSVNDTLGHEKGDMLLQSVAERLHIELGSNYFVARFGGDEFVILMSHLEHIAHVDELAGKVIQKLSQPIRINHEEFFITASGGISVYPDDGDTSEALLKNADLAMNAAKASGKNRHRLCTTEMKDAIEIRVAMINMLHKAQENNELEVYYQPQVNINTGEIIGLEALLRWKNHKFGEISPLTFIPLAEKHGLIHSIGNWVLETACQQIKVWQEKGLKPVKIAVNVSIQQFKNDDIAESIFSVLDKTGVDPHYLEIELTESFLIEDTEKIVSILSVLKRKGITISIDDFGTAYSSLERIKELPIDRIKIAMEFISQISVSKKDEELVKVILNLAERLGFSVIAEGVETKTQLDFLKYHNCEEVQGFYYYRPMSSKDMEDILRD